MLVSIITVSRNSEDTIRQTIEAVYGQSWHQIEYIIIDGASTDHTMDIVKEYQEKFKKKGMAYQYVSEPDAVECAVQHYRQQPYDLFYADLRIIGSKGDFIKKAKDSRWITSRYWNHPTTFIPKAVYQKYPYKNENIHDDWDLILRIRKDGARVCVENKVLANFRRNGVSHEKGLKKAMERAKMKYKIYRDNGYSRWYVVECYGMEMAKLVV